MPALNFFELTLALQAARLRERKAWVRRQRACARLKGFRRLRHRWSDVGTGGAWPQRQAEFWTLQFETETLIQLWVLDRAQALSQGLHAHDPSAGLPFLEAAHQEVPQALLDLVFLERT